MQDMGITKKASSKSPETKVVPDEADGVAQYTASAEASAQDGDDVGELALDVFQTEKEVVIVAPIAGVTMDDIGITVTETDAGDEVLEIRGRRPFHFTVAPSDYVTQECFWGSFSRMLILPSEADATHIHASFKSGILTIRIPKVERVKTRMVKIKSE